MTIPQQREPIEEGIAAALAASADSPVIIPPGFGPRFEERIPNVEAALAIFQADLPKVRAAETAEVAGKEGSRGYKYSYAGLDDVSEVVLRRLGALGVAWITRPTVGERGMFLHYRLVHAASGTAVEGEWPIPGGTMQAMGSSITYIRRYSLLAVTGVFPGGEDDDGAASSRDAEAEAEKRMQARREAAQREAEERQRQRAQRQEEPAQEPKRSRSQDDTGREERAARGVPAAQMPLTREAMKGPAPVPGPPDPAAAEHTARNEAEMPGLRESVERAIEKAAASGVDGSEHLPAQERVDGVANLLYGEPDSPFHLIGEAARAYWELGRGGLTEWKISQHAEELHPDVRGHKPSAVWADRLVHAARWAEKNPDEVTLEDLDKLAKVANACLMWDDVAGYLERAKAALR